MRHVKAGWVMLAVLFGMGFVGCSQPSSEKRDPELVASEKLMEELRVVCDAVRELDPGMDKERMIKQGQMKKELDVLKMKGKTEMGKVGGTLESTTIFEIKQGIERAKQLIAAFQG